MKWIILAGAASGAAAITLPSTLDVTNKQSVRDVAATLAFEAMSWYKGNLTAMPASCTAKTPATCPVQVGDLPDDQPYYWWVAGSLWGAMLDYYHYTGDSSYNNVVTEALLNPQNMGENLDYTPAAHASEEGNDDLFFWGAAVMSAAERNFPQTDDAPASWLQLARNVFDGLDSRWDNKTCGGGLHWQIYASNPNGLDYKNSVSNGGFFHLAARLYAATGEDKYLEAAKMVWDWSTSVKFVAKEASGLRVYDGAGSSEGCKKVSAQSYSYTTGIYLYGAAVLASAGSDEAAKATWADRAQQLLTGADFFFKDGVLYEPTCETLSTTVCSVDSTTHKGQLARLMWQSAKVLPQLEAGVAKLLKPSAQAAAQSCSGGADKATCGLRWYKKAYDGSNGDYTADTLGPEMSALETIQGLLLSEFKAPLKGAAIKQVKGSGSLASLSS